MLTENGAINLTAAPGKKSDPDNVAVTITLPKHVIAHFEKKALQDERSVNKYIARELRRMYEQETQPKDPAQLAAHVLHTHS